MVRVLPDPPLPNETRLRTHQELKRYGVEAGSRSLKTGKVASVLRRMSMTCREAKAGAERHLIIESLNSRLGFVPPNTDDPEATWGYMVKRISAHGGCLGGQRR